MVQYDLRETFRSLINEVPPAAGRAPGPEPLGLPDDHGIFAEDVLRNMMAQWGADLKKAGHVLELEHGWIDAKSSYPAYTLHLQGGARLALYFVGSYPETLLLTIALHYVGIVQVNDAPDRMTIHLPVTMDANRIFGVILDQQAR
ncbi:MAG: hypothetical protein ABI599_12915 [Flavobacteriales bacterium]